VMILVRVVDGEVKKGDRIKFISTGRTYEVTSMGVFSPKAREVDSLAVGDVGFIGANIKDLVQAKIGDTVTLADATPEPLPGFVDVKPMVFAGIFPINTDEYSDLRDAMDKLKLNDASFTYELE
jgi:GTP-binding protein LepA